MLLAEPPATQFDLHFRISNIPVRVHPFFWLFGVILGATGAGASDHPGVVVLIWVSALFVSILIHELGHAVVMRRFRESPRIVLYMMGGLAIADDRFNWSNSGETTRSTPEQVIISAAGPIAGFLFALLIAVGVLLGGGSLTVAQSQLVLPTVWAFFPEGTAPLLGRAINALLFINIFWGLVNLLPVYPLDGGQIARALFMAHDPWNGAVRSLWLSTITGGIFAVMALLLTSSIFIPILFGLLAISSYMTLMQYQGGGGFGGGGGGRPW